MQQSSDRKAFSSKAIAAAAAMASAAAAAQSPASAPMEETVVRATYSRIPLDLSSVPGSITVIDEEELQKQSLFSNDLGEILERTVPGLGVSSRGSFSNFSQTMRGRKPAVFIDGIPTTVPLRDGGRDLRVISPSAIGRVEVIRGTTSVYGLGGAGGLINYVTADPGEGPTRFRTDLSMGFSVDEFSDSPFYTLQQSVMGRQGRFSYNVNGFYETYGSLFDANGDRIPPDPQLQGGIADTESYNLFAKLGFDLTDSASIYATINSYETEQDTDYVSGVGVFGSEGAPAVKGEPPGQGQTTENQLFSLRYVDQDLFGSVVSAQIFYSDYEAIFGFNPAPVFPPDGGQSLIEAERAGLRFDVQTPFQLGDSNGNLLWGVDYVVDETTQPLTDGRILVPTMEQTSLAPFLQVDYAATDWLNVVGGIRYEDAEVKVGDFTTIPLFAPSLLGGNNVEGGTLDYSEALFNVGAVVSPFREGALAGIDFFAGYSEGFTVNDFGRALRATTQPSIEAFNFEPQITESFEIGVRYASDYVDVSFAWWESESELGSTFNPTTLELVRAPEELNGLEFMVDARPSDTIGVGASITWMEGDVTNAAGVEDSLDSTRIPPLKFTAYYEQSFGRLATVRLNLTHSAKQSLFDNEQVFGRADIQAFTLLDTSVRGKVGPGILTLAINNLLNEEYFTPDAFRFAGAGSFTTGVGTTARLTYAMEY